MKKSSELRLNDLCNKIVALIMLIFTICSSLFTIGSLIYSDSKKLNALRTMFDLKNTMMVLIGVLVLGCIYLFITKFFINKWPLYKIQQWSLLATFLAGLFTIVIYSALPLNTDPAILMRYPMDWVYINQFSYQLPLGLVDSSLVYLFGLHGAILFFRLLNVMLLVVAFFYLGKITQIVFNDGNSVKLFYLIAPVCFQFTLYITFCYGSFPGACLMIIATYNLMSWLNTGKKLHAVGFISLSFVGYAIRVNSVIFVIAFVVILALRFTRKQIIPIVCLVMIPLITIPLFATGTNFLLKSVGSEIRVESEYASLSNIAQGLNAWLPEDRQLAKDQGLYTDEQIDNLLGTWSFIINTHTTNALGRDEAQEISKKRILHRLQEFIDDPQMAMRYFVRKTLYNWAQPDFLSLRNDMDKRDAENSSFLFDTTDSKVMHSIYCGTIYKILFSFEDIFESFFYLFAMLAVSINYKRRDTYFVTIPLIFIGQVAFSFVSETRAIYHYGYFVLLSPFVAAGLYGLYQKLQNVRRVNRRKDQNV